MNFPIPRIEINLSKIKANAQILSDFYLKKGISIMGVTKATPNAPRIAEAMIQGGIKFIADSRLENIINMRHYGISTQFVLLRTSLSQAESVVENVDISLNTEIVTIQKLSHYAKLHNKPHKIIIMIELGDLREGVLPCDIFQFISQVMLLSHIKIIGIGCNLCCYAGVKPDEKNMTLLSELVNAIEKKFQINVEITSGGNSSNYNSYKATKNVGRINNLRLGESILLGCETVNRTIIPGLHTDVFQLIAEVIESKNKPSIPCGEICPDAFGNIQNFTDLGTIKRIIIALGQQDIIVSGLKLSHNLKILGSNSDHLIIHDQSNTLQVGEEVLFNLKYSALLSAMTSPFIKKKFIQ